MKFARRTFLHLAAGAAALPATSQTAWTQSYPTRPVRWIVAGPVGGGGDIVTRVIAQSLSRRLGQPFVVENVPGAGNNIGTEAVVHASADGYTLLLATAGNAINATLYDKLKFNFIRDIAPVVSIAQVPWVIALHPSVPGGTVAEFIAYAKANSGKLKFASIGTGSTQHLSTELFKMSAGIEIVHVPYRGVAPAINALLDGQVQMMFPSIPSSIDYIKAGKLRSLAVTTAVRSPALPDVPTAGEFVPGFEANDWYGLGVPKDTSAEIIDKLNKEFNAGLADAELKARLTDLGLVVRAGSSADFGTFIRAETEKWATVIRAANIRPE